VSELQKLYRDVILRHSQSPHGWRQDIGATHEHEAFNPLCGDRIHLFLRVSGEQVEAAAFDGEACAICLASVSLLCESAPGETTGRLRQRASQLIDALGNGADGAAPQDLAPLLGVRPYPGRIRCATLPWSAAIEALKTQPDKR
jgi:nitrogen fixation NifU-like protein